MKTSKYSRFFRLSVMAAAVLVSALPFDGQAQAKGPPDFAEAPSLRAEMARQAKNRALQDKNEVAAWASRRALPSSQGGG